MKERIRGRLGPVSKVSFLIWALTLTALLPDRQLVALLAVVLAYGFLGGRKALSPLLRVRFWVMILSIVVLSSLLIGEADWPLGSLRLSRSGLELGGWMALRAMCLTLAFSVSVGSMSPSDMIGLFESMGLKGLGFALGVALNLLSVLGEIIETTYHTLRLRGGFRRPWTTVRLLLVTVISNALRYGDDVVVAASARGFDPATRQGGVSVLRRADGVFAMGLLGLGGLLLFWPL